MKKFSKALKYIKRSFVLTVLFSTSIFTLLGILINVLGLNKVLFFPFTILDSTIIGFVLGIISFEVKRIRQDTV